MPRGIIDRIQDPVHGLMQFREMETVLLDLLSTPEMQRLKRINQLGLVHYVFPGAEHSRFIHSLGASHIAIRFGHHLKDSAYKQFSKFLLPSDDAIRDFAIATLCHDLGHGPLSHMWEREVIGEEFNRKKWCNKIEIDYTNDLGKLKWHELIAQGILAWKEGFLHKKLENHEDGFSKRISNFLKGSYYLQYLPKLLSSDIDVDRADYIKRDTQQTGVTYGKYDLDWLIATCKLGFEVNSGKLVIGFDERKGLRVIEQFLNARRALYDIVYFHKTVRCADGMYGLFLKRLRDLARNDSSGALSSPIFKPIKAIVNGEGLNIPELLALDDVYLGSLINHVVNNGNSDSVLKDLGSWILSRKFFKMVPVESSQIEDFLPQEDSREKIHRIIKKYVSGDAKYYLVEDSKNFSMITDTSIHESYIINENSEAVAFKSYEGFDDLKNVKYKERRLFTISEAVDELTDLIRSST
jgi:HD superfamily phosphohydrolase